MCRVWQPSPVEVLVEMVGKQLDEDFRMDACMRFPVEELSSESSSFAAPFLYVCMIICKYVFMHVSLNGSTMI